MKKSLGYVLIEILIVLSIIVLFSALSLAYYRNFAEQKKLDAETKQLIDILNLASKKSSAGDLSPNPICSNFQGYYVELAPPSTYTLQFNCNGSPTDIQSYTLQTGLTFTLLPDVGTFSILFKPLSSGTNLSISSPLYVIITNNTTGNCISLRINPIGTVEEETNVCHPQNPQ